MRKALGRGLSSLISTPAVPLTAKDEESSKIVSFESKAPAKELVAAAKTEPFRERPDRGVQYVDIAILTNNPKQPRQFFKEEELEQLASSIKEQGMIQPIVVRPINNTISTFQYEIVAGERRWRAAGKANITQVPVIIRELDDRQTLELGIIENVQRENLNVVELAKAYERLATDFSLSHEEVAGRVGKDRVTVTNVIRILKLHQEVLELLSEDKLSLGHAKVLLTLRDQAAQLSLARRVEKDQLSVRALESLVSQVAVLDRGPRASRKVAKSVDAQQDNTELESRLRYALGTKVILEKSSHGSGTIQIQFASNDELDRLLEKLAPRE